MKTRNIIYATFLSLLLILSSVSCSDEFLEQPSIGSYDESVLADAEGINSLLIGIYSKLSGTNSSFAGMLSTPWTHILGAVRGGEALVGTESGDGASWEIFANMAIPTTCSFAPAVFEHYYDAISMVNQLLNLLPEVTDMSEEDKTYAKAEALFLRAHFYFILKRNWGNIPWIDENTADVRVSNYDEAAGDYIDCWENIEADMEYAADNLPEEQSEIARANSWAAKAYLVKIRMEEEKYDTETYNLVKEVIADGKTSSGEDYDLMPYYHDNFDPDQENNKENVFQVQISVNTGTTPGFMGYSFVNPENIWLGSQKSDGPGYGRGWGYIAPSQWYVDHFRVNTDGLPYLDYYETNTESVKNDYSITSNEEFTPTTEELDPRLDWSVGRRGIPYLGWGVMPGTNWMRDATGEYNGPYIQKKWMYDAAYEGVHNQTDAVYNAINGHVIRFADVLLWAAELAVRVDNDLVAAKDYVNLVRARMQDEDGWVKTEDGTANAANYKIGLYTSFSSTEEAMTAILFERTLELGLEGHRFYDLVRWGQDWIEKELVDYWAFQDDYTTYLVGAEFEYGKDELLPFSQAAITTSQIEGVATLTQNPGY